MQSKLPAPEKMRGSNKPENCFLLRPYLRPTSFQTRGDKKVPTLSHAKAWPKTQGFEDGRQQQQQQQQQQQPYLRLNRKTQLDIFFCQKNSEDATCLSWLPCLFPKFLSQLQQRTSPLQTPALPKLRAANAKASPMSRALPSTESSAWKNACLRVGKSLSLALGKAALKNAQKFWRQAGPTYCFKKLGIYSKIQVMFCQQLLSQSSSSCRLRGIHTGCEMYERTNCPMILLIRCSPYAFPSHDVRPWPLDKLTWTMLESIPGRLFSFKAHIMPRNIMPVTQPILTHLAPSSARRQPAFGAMAACRAAASLSTRRCRSTSKNCRAWCHRAAPVKEDRRMVHSCPGVQSEECGQNCAWTS